MKSYIIKSLFLFGVLAWPLSGYSEPVVSDGDLLVESEFFSSNINEITILPVIDIRKSKKAELDIDFTADFQKIIRAKISGEIITIKEYKVNNPDSDEVNYSKVINHSSEWIKNLGPNDARYVLIVVFSGATANSSVVADKISSASLSGYFFDKKIGKLLWKDLYVSDDESGGFGLLWGLKGAITPDFGVMFKAITRAVAGLMKSFPVNGASIESYNVSLAGNE